MVSRVRPPLCMQNVDVSGGQIVAAARAMSSPSRSHKLHVDSRAQHRQLSQNSKADSVPPGPYPVDTWGPEGPTHLAEQAQPKAEQALPGQEPATDTLTDTPLSQQEQARIEAMVVRVASQEGYWSSLSHRKARLPPQEDPHGPQTKMECLQNRVGQLERNFQDLLWVVSKEDTQVRKKQKKADAEAALVAELEALLDGDDEPFEGITEAGKIAEMAPMCEIMEDRVAVATESVAPVSTDVAVASQTTDGEPSSSSSESWEAWLASLPVEDMSDPDANHWQYGSIGGKTPFCRIRKMSNQGKDNLQVDNYKVDCKIHPGCSLWVTKQPQGYEQYRILKEGIEWGASGLSLNKDDHQTAAQVIKESYGMMVRRKRVSIK